MLVWCCLLQMLQKQLPPRQLKQQQLLLQQLLLLQLLTRPQKQLTRPLEALQRTEKHPMQQQQQQQLLLLLLARQRPQRVLQHSICAAAFLV